MAEITLSKAVRSNLLNLQSTASLLSKSQERLSSGLRVNSALDNPTNFFTAQGLNSRASDLSALADAVSNAVQTVAAADKGITAITKLVESAQATARQALQTAATIDTGAQVLATTTSSDVTNLTVAGGTAKAARIEGGTFSTIDVGAGSLGIGIDSDSQGGMGLNLSTSTIAAYNGLMSRSFNASALTAQDIADIINYEASGLTASVESGRLVIESNTLGTGGAVSVGVTETSIASGTTGWPTTYTTVNGSAANTAGDVTVNGQTISLADDDRAADILLKFQNAAAATSGTNAFTASMTAGVLTLTGTAGNDLAIDGDAGTLAALGLSTTTLEGTPGGAQPNPKRAELVSTYNDLLGQIDALAKDSGFNGVNLLNGDNLSVIFNEDGSSKIDIQGVDNTTGVNGLNLAALTGTAFDTNAGVNDVLDDLKGTIDTLRSQSAKFGSNLSVVETRQDFTKQMISVLQTGAANLTLADTNEEAANVLALQTRQQLSSTALSLASQADQNVLRLF